MILETDRLKLRPAFPNPMTSRQLRPIRRNQTSSDSCRYLHKVIARRGAPAAELRLAQ
jgi:hypothetical protein